MCYKEDDLAKYVLEVENYHSDAKLPAALGHEMLDEWWSAVGSQYPHLWMMVKDVISCFHGLPVESVFSIMNTILLSNI